MSLEFVDNLSSCIASRRTISFHYHAHYIPMYLIATLDYTKNANFDRNRPQHLYLSSSSPVFHTLALPKGFIISSTPLVTFRRVDLFFSQDELVDIHRAIQPTDKTLQNSSPFNEDPVWTLPVSPSSSHPYPQPTMPR